MGVEDLDSDTENTPEINLELVQDYLTEEIDDDRASSLHSCEIDARRRLDQKLDDLRLRREMQEFDFG